MDGWRTAARALAARGLVERVAARSDAQASLPAWPFEPNDEQRVAIDAVRATGDRLCGAAARRRHRQRQDRGLPACDRRLPGARTAGAGAGAGDRIDAADAGALPRAARRAGACAAFGPQRQRARARLDGGLAWRGAGDRRHALGDFHAAAARWPDRRRRGTRRQLQAAGRHPLPRARLRAGPRQDAGRFRCCSAARRRRWNRCTTHAADATSTCACAPARATHNRRPSACSTCASDRCRLACRRNSWMRSAAHWRAAARYWSSRTAAATHRCCCATTAAGARNAGAAMRR